MQACERTIKCRSQTEKTISLRSGTLSKSIRPLLAAICHFKTSTKNLQDPARKYTAPNGELLVAVEDGRLLGMVAYHRHSDVRCEMKRLYVCPEARGKHLGSALVEIGRAHV